ncbi:Apoptosis-inducing factor 1 [Penicillium atrosanguineum]|uniref:Apoptosis-inducing factor 1 n=1 Tax=Penicillium atrosanguineum TaxID=1132637 RepID=UPI002392C0D6|nr:Apoptosis-inducing factor 1 [Penicillium atrosanguineum]KAJ5300517.1 Apoptosis-inducing factor 1 [Penicillium atrosanguineum]
MRYENWDVLIFPEGTKVPVQEFKTQCFVIRETESSYLQNVSTGHSYYPVQGNYGQLPVLTTFIPSMTKDSPYRFSIHSWEKPRPSRLIEGMMQPDDLLMYEARVFVDQQCVAAGFFSQRTQWPYVIVLTSTGKAIRMHSVFLLSTAKSWINATGMQAIQTVASVSLLPKDSLVLIARPPFERFKDVIMFSFQHAPLHILEYSTIAWPNPSMWAPSRPAFKYTGTCEPKAADDHSHSPSKSGPRLAAMSLPSVPQSYNPWAQTRPFPLPQTWSDQDPRYANVNHRFSEPFAEPTSLFNERERGWSQRGARSSREDIPMPDYSSSSASSRVISSDTGNSYEQVHMDDDQYNMLIQALTPTKAGGVRAPSNTPSATINAAKLGRSPSGNIKSKKEVSILDDTQETPKKSTQRVAETVKENSREVSGQDEDAISISSTL